MTGCEARAGGGQSLECIEDWMVDYLARETKIDAQDVDIKLPFAGFGLDSAAATAFIAALAAWLERDLDPTLAFDYPSIVRLSRHLAGGSNQ